MRGYSSVAEHSTADREVAGSTPAVPCNKFFTLLRLHYNYTYPRLDVVSYFFTINYFYLPIVPYKLTDKLFQTNKYVMSPLWSLLAISLFKTHAPPGNRTRVARMGILHDTTTPAAPSGDAGDRTRGLSHAKRTLYH